MKNTIKILLICLTITSCQSNKDFDVLITGNLPVTKAEYQKVIVGQLSGKYTLGNGTIIKSRWSKNERAMAKNYLKELITTLNIKPEENSYTSPNINPAIDLIIGPFKGTNIYGVLPATNNSSEYIILGAHYDSGKRNAPGAIDNATGIALIYGIVKELSKVEVRNKNIIIVFFDQEEEEQIGSMAFAKLIMDKEWNVHSIHSFDMVGWDGDNDFAMEIYSASASLINTYKAVAEQKKIPLKDILIDPVGYDNRSTDFDVFVPLGYNAIGAGECFYHRDSTPYKDSPDDTFDTVNFNYLLSCSDLLEDIIKEIVSR